MKKRASDRTADALRPTDVVTGFHRLSEGSALYRAGGTLVLVTASLEDGVPKWMDEDEGGWLTAEYQMHPRANPKRREEREGRNKPPKGRTLEIQRLVGRALRSALDLKALGPRTLTIDCDVLEADGGTRTASVTAGFIATALALHSRGLARVIRDQVAAVSVGFVDGEVLVDLDYSEDSRARVDLNVVATLDGRLIEVQGTAEGRAIPRPEFDRMLDAALGAIRELGERQRQALEAAGADLRILMKKAEG
ncbi:MAG: ribonuclease PH [Deltaproteobacteria bacterium]|nr:ribonuclease PH [Deltaproteobacteria bacterium]